MKSLMIKDLSASKELDRKTMSAVRGGIGNQANATTQANAQLMIAPVSVGNGSLIGGNVQVDSKPTQTATNYSESFNFQGLGLYYPYYQHAA